MNAKKFLAAGVAVLASVASAHAETSFYQAVPATGAVKDPRYCHLMANVGDKSPMTTLERQAEKCGSGKAAVIDVLLPGSPQVFATLVPAQLCRLSGTVIRTVDDTGSVTVVCDLR